MNSTRPRKPFIFFSLLLPLQLMIENSPDRHDPGGHNKGFHINFHIQEDIRMREQVEKALEKIRPMLQRDGGSVELVDVVGSVVKVRLTGACHGCPMSQMTLKSGIERIIKQEVPTVTEVVAV
jgi:Fe-S cluster biogenesis protein NfuA